MYDVGLVIYIYICKCRILFWYFLFPLNITITLNRSVNVYPLVSLAENGHSRRGDSNGSVCTVRYCVWFLLCGWSFFCMADPNGIDTLRVSSLNM